MNGLGKFFDQLRARAKTWRALFFVALVVLVGLNLVIGPEEAHFGVDAIPGFFAAFGLIVGLILLLVMEKVGRPLITRKEDYYGDV
jgi:hypothetical protein